MLFVGVAVFVGIALVYVVFGDCLLPCGVGDLVLFVVVAMLVLICWFMLCIAVCGLLCCLVWVWWLVDLLLVVDCVSLVTGCSLSLWSSDAVCVVLIVVAAFALRCELLMLSVWEYCLVVCDLLFYCEVGYWLVLG